MSTKPNPRREHGRIQDNGPFFEQGGSDDTHVARSRSKWKRRRARSERRTGKTSPKVAFVKPRVRPEIKTDE